MKELKRPMQRYSSTHQPYSDFAPAPLPVVKNHQNDRKESTFVAIVNKSKTWWYSAVFSFPSLSKSYSWIVSCTQMSSLPCEIMCQKLTLSKEVILLDLQLCHLMSEEVILLDLQQYHLDLILGCILVDKLDLPHGQEAILVPKDRTCIGQKTPHS